MLWLWVFNFKIWLWSGDCSFIDNFVSKLNTHKTSRVSCQVNFPLYSLSMYIPQRVKEYYIYITSNPAWSSQRAMFQLSEMFFSKLKNCWLLREIRTVIRTLPLSVKRHHVSIGKVAIWLSMTAFWGPWCCVMLVAMRNGADNASSTYSIWISRHTIGIAYKKYNGIKLLIP